MMADPQRSGRERQRLRAERAAAALRDRERQERRRRLRTVAVVVAALALVVGVGFLVSSMRDPAAETAAAIPEVGSRYGVVVGEDTAPHRVVVYEDFLCPICGAFEKAAHEQLARLAEQGRVQVEYRPFVLLSRLGPYSHEATAVWSQVLENDGPQAALAFHDLLFADQPEESGPFPTRQDLVDLAGRAGADVAALRAAVQAGDGADWADAATAAAVGDGVTSTPTVVLDGRLFTDYRTPDDLAANLVEAVQ